MHHFVRKITRNASIWAAVLTVVGAAGISASRADEAHAKSLLKAMSDYLAAQTAISFEMDSTLEVVTKDGQKLALVSSGALTLNRPDKLHATRKGGFADVELAFDGKTVTLLESTQTHMLKPNRPARSISWSTYCATSTAGPSRPRIC